MWTTIECAGHPRDMGLAQGSALGSAIRAEVARAGLAVRRSRLPSLRSLTVGPVRGRGAGRELFRHFAHQAERLEGMARRADVPLDSLLELHLRLRAGGVQAGLLARRSTLCARNAREDGAKRTVHERPLPIAKRTVHERPLPIAKRTVLERSLPAANGDEVGWIVRESRPAVGFRSIEITLPWLVSAVAGVNEGGLAVAAGPMLWGAAGLGGWAPSVLLVQECLQRFEDLGGALDWCRKRPVEGEQSFVLADASGATATVLATGRERSVQAGEGELYLEGGELPAEPAARGASSGAGRVRLDPGRAALCIEAPGARLEFALRDAAPAGQ
jgi:hypothetical protein